MRITHSLREFVYIDLKGNQSPCHILPLKRVSSCKVKISLLKTNEESSSYPIHENIFPVLMENTLRRLEGE